MKARLSRPKRSNPSVAWEGNSERRGRAKRAQRACEPERKESAAFSLGRVVFAAAAGWAEKEERRRAAAPFLACWRAFGSAGAESVFYCLLLYAAWLLGLAAQ